LKDHPQVAAEVEHRIRASAAQIAAGMTRASGSAAGGGEDTGSATEAE
jgi:hypothetical protein